MPGSERHRFLEGQRVRILRGEDTTFDNEARALNGVTFPVKRRPSKEPDADDSRAPFEGVESTRRPL